MKHLKLFENYSEDDLVEIGEYCRDILIELEDYGFTTEVNSWPDSQYYVNQTIVIQITNRRIFRYDDITDVVDRLNEYLKTQGLNRYSATQCGKSLRKNQYWLAAGDPFVLKYD
jgi:hypothetical protein